MPRPDLQIRADGRWLTAIAPWGGLTYSTIADGGCDEASWSMPMLPTFRHPALVRGKVIEVRLGSVNVWQGRLDEPEQTDDGWSFHAAGLHAASRGYLCLTAAGVTTSTPDVAIDRAIADGLPWVRPASLSNVPFADAGSDGTDALNKLGDLLDTWATSVSKRWGVDPDRNVYAAADPTTAAPGPTWHMTPGSGSFGYADEDYASHVYLRYYDTTYNLATATASDATAAAVLGRVEVGVDGREYGAITAAKAGAYVQGLMDKGAARMAWTNSLSPSRWQLTTPGGAPACLPMVKAQQLVRLHGLTDVQGQPVPFVDFVIGRTVYDVVNDALTIEPTQLAPRSLADVLTAAAVA